MSVFCSLYVNFTLIYQTQTGETLEMDHCMYLAAAAVLLRYSLNSCGGGIGVSAFI